ncbi:MAG: FAD-binding protein [Pseudomonadota bacterium]
MSILILAEHDGVHLKQSVRQAVSAAAAWLQPIHLLVAGAETAALVREAAAISTVTRVIDMQAPQFQHPLAEDVAAALLELGRDYRVIIAAHTAFGRSVLPRVAALLDVAMVSDVLSIATPATYTRPIYAGNVLATLESRDPIQVLTVRASSHVVAGNDGAAEIVQAQAPAATSHSRWVSETRNLSDRPELASARVVISGGRSLGSQFNAVLDPLARRLGAALGATRACVDAGFAPNDIQVGQTGTVVAPDLYIAVGISGAVQHLAGMRGSKVIVAINHDPDAAIFQNADFGLVADLFEAVPELTAALK